MANPGEGLAKTLTVSNGAFLFAGSFLSVGLLKSDMSRERRLVLASKASTLA